MKSGRYPGKESGCQSEVDPPNPVAVKSDTETRHGLSTTAGTDRPMTVPDKATFCSKWHITVSVVHPSGTLITPLRRTWCCDAFSDQLITGVESATGKTGKLVYIPSNTEFYTPGKVSRAKVLKGCETFSRQGVANTTTLTFVASEHVAHRSVDGLAWRHNVDRANKVGRKL